MTGKQELPYALLVGGYVGTKTTLGSGKLLEAGSYVSTLGSSAEVVCFLLLGSSWRGSRDFSFRTHCRVFNDAAVAELQGPSCSTSLSPVATHPQPPERRLSGRY